MLFLILIPCLYTEKIDLTIGKNLIRNTSTELNPQPLSFIDELVANSIDAILRLLAPQSDIDIKNILISFNKDQIIFRDFGIGMNVNTFKEKLCSFGTSSNTEFDENLIGKFGWGFFSIFNVAESCYVYSKLVKTNIVTRAFYKPYDSNDNFNLSMDVDTYQSDDFAEGTEIIINLKKNYTISERDVIDRVSNMFIEDGRFRYIRIKIKKTPETIQKEIQLKQSEIESEIKGIEDNIQAKRKELDQLILDEKNKTINKNNQDLEHKNEVDDEKKNEDLEQGIKEDLEQMNEEDNKKKNEDPEQENELNKEEEISKKISNLETEIKELESELESVKSSISEINVDEYSNIPLFPWIEKTDGEKIKKHAKELLKLDNINFAQFDEFKFLGDNNLPGPEFKALILIPDYTNSVMSQQEFENGSFAIYVSGVKMMNSEAIKPFGFLKGCHIFVKANNVKLNSLRTNFLDQTLAKRVLENIYIRAIKLLKKQGAEKIYQYERPLKASFLEVNQGTFQNPSIAEALKSCLCFINQENKPMTLESLVKLLNKIKKSSEQQDDVTNFDSAHAGGIYYTTIPHSLAKDYPSPVTDGCKAPFIFVNSIIDEQLVSQVKNFGGYKLVNLLTATFKNKEKAEDPDLCKFFETTLKSFISTCTVSTELIKLPFKIVQPQNALSSLIKSAIGVNDIENNPMRMFFDQKPALHINLDNEDIIRINELRSVDLEKAENAAKILFIASSIGSCSDLYSKKHGYLELLNVAKNILGNEKIDIKEDKSDFSSLFGNNMFGGNVPQEEEALEDNPFDENNFFNQDNLNEKIHDEEKEEIPEENEKVDNETVFSEEITSKQETVREDL